MSFKSTFSAAAMALVAMLPILIQLATAHPTTDLELAANTNISTAFTAWARFCDDTECSINCGEWVDLMNSGCLNERGRQSIKVKSNGPDPMVGLVYSPGQDCNCQTECGDYQGINPDCWGLNTSLSLDTLSYRFINWGKFDDGAGGQCHGSEDNCPASYLLDAAGPATTDAETLAEDNSVDEHVTDIEDLANANAPDSTSWGRFCNDAACNDCGIWVDLDNDGCLAENGRVAVQLKDNGPGTDVGLNYCDQDAECGHHAACQELTSGPNCYLLDAQDAPSTTNYQFINLKSSTPCFSDAKEDSSPAVLAMAAPTATSAPNATHAIAHADNAAGAWARFCGDDDCSVGCGQWVDIANPHCLGQNGRGSVELKTNGANLIVLAVGLVYSPDAKCSCQSDCQEVSADFMITDQCFKLDDLAKTSHSFRFINYDWRDPCVESANNCPA